MSALIISFSGIDGAGKSTQIQKLREYFSASGIPVTDLTFWDNVVMFPRLRAGFSRRVLQSDGNIGTPERPAERRDKNTQNAPLLFGRSILHFFDVVNLRRIVRKAKSQNSGVVIFDRYIYDQLAALPMQSWWARTFARLQYPIEFMRKYRSSYLELCRLANLKLISPGSVDEVHQAIVDTFSTCVLEKQNDSRMPSAVVA